MIHSRPFADSAPAEDSAAVGEDVEGSLHGERAGKEAYKGLQASSAAAIARQKAARTQVRLTPSPPPLAPHHPGGSTWA